MMRHALLLIVAAVLAACGSSGPAPKPVDGGEPQEPFEPGAPMRITPDVPGQEQIDGAPRTTTPIPMRSVDVAPLGFSPRLLVGQGETAVSQRLGTPDRKRQEGAAISWVYETDLCVLTISFYKAVGGSNYRALQYRIKRPIAYSRGAGVPNELACTQSILARN